MTDQVRDEKVKFSVACEFTIDGVKQIGEETEAGWYLIDQQGKFYSNSPLRPIRPCTEEDKLELKLKICDEYLTISEIEKRLKNRSKIK